MRAAQFFKAKDIQVNDIELGQVKEGQVKVKVAWAGIC